MPIAQPRNNSANFQSAKRRLRGRQVRRQTAGCKMRAYNSRFGDARRVRSRRSIAAGIHSASAMNPSTRNAHGIPIFAIILSRERDQTAPPMPPPAYTKPLARPRRRRKYCAGRALHVCSQCSVKIERHEARETAYHESQAHTKAGADAIRHKQPSDILR